MKYQIAIFDRQTREYLGIRERNGAPELYATKEEADAWAQFDNATDFNRQYEACEHHEAR